VAQQQGSGIEAYVVGREYDVMPIAMVPEHCVPVAAGPVTFVVESRHLTDEIINHNARSQGRPDGVLDLVVDDGGASLHVLATSDGVEHLRFDCFELEPHYHYIRNDQQTNVVVAIDVHAEGDPLRMALRCVRERLPEMLEFAGAHELASALRSDPAVVLDAVPAVEDLLVQAAARRSTGG
jgi:hypothetical protein